MRMLSPAPLAVAAIVLATTLVAAHVREQTPTWPREPEQPSAPKPELPFRDWFLLIGEYESAPAPGRLAVHLYVLERDARLMVIADRGPARDVNTMAPRPVFTRDAARRATALTIGSVVHRRLQVGPEGGSGQLRVTPIRPVAEVLKESQSQTPPAEAGSFLSADLVELTALDPTIKRCALRHHQQLLRIGLLRRSPCLPAAARRSGRSARAARAGAVRLRPEAEGFAVNPEEWWHFDHQDWRRYAIGNVAFDRIQPRPAPGAVVAQTGHGTKPALPVMASFDGLGAGLHAGDTPRRNPSDNSLAGGPNHVRQIVNSQLAVFSKAGTRSLPGMQRCAAAAPTATRSCASISSPIAGSS